MKQLHHTHPASTTYLVYRKQDNGRRQKNKTAEGYARSKMHQDSTSAPPAPRPQRSLLTYWQRRKRRLQQDWKRAVPATLWWNEHNDNTAPSQGQPLPSAPSQRRPLPSALSAATTSFYVNVSKPATTTTNKTSFTAWRPFTQSPPRKRRLRRPK